jgi:hypothetical protein
MGKRLAKRVLFVHYLTAGEFAGDRKQLSTVDSSPSTGLSPTDTGEVVKFTTCFVRQFVNDR